MEMGTIAAYMLFFILEIYLNSKFEKIFNQNMGDRKIQEEDKQKKPNNFFKKRLIIKPNEKPTTFFIFFIIIQLLSVLGFGLSVYFSEHIL
jgi:hypothetical protein